MVNEMDADSQLDDSAESYYVTHNTSRIDINGTHLQGYLDISYEDLVNTFGEPGLGFDKTDWEWAIRFANDEVATIYNWKNGPNYGVHGPPEDIWEWNVGGHVRGVVELVKAALLSDGALPEANRRLDRLW
jgi:hypothetical protein